MSTWKAGLTRRLKLPARSMHPFPCSALLACFGYTRENAPFDQSSVADSHSTIYVQPTAKEDRQPSHPQGEEGAPEKRRDSGTHSERNGSAHRNSSNHTALQPAETPKDLPVCLDDGPDGKGVTFQASIPRPSIIEMSKEEEGSHEEPQCPELEEKTTAGIVLQGDESVDDWLTDSKSFADCKGKSVLAQ